MSPARVPRASALACAGAALLLAVSPARANGRYPAARNFVVGPAAAGSPLVLATTFGFALSADGGRSWRWVCESGLGFSDTWDPPPAFLPSGRLAVGLPDGLAVGRVPDYCTFDRPATMPQARVIDLAVDALGTRLAAAVAPLDAPNGVALSDDEGATWRAGWTAAGFQVETVDVAPGHPDVLYASGAGADGNPVLYRSGDGGASFALATRDFHGGYSAYVTAVDPADPNTLYVRTDLPTGETLLLRSADAGASFTELARTAAPMTAVAFAPDARTIWVGSSDRAAGLARSSDGGATWTHTPLAFAPLCLRYVAGVLWACADNYVDGAALFSSTDDGAHFTARFAFRDLQPPDSCPAGTPVHDQCVSRWPAQSAILARNTDAGLDAGDAGDASAMDVASVPDAVADTGPAPDARESAPPTRGCHCRAAGVSMHGGGAGVLALLAAALGLRPRRARPRAAR